ncbi:TPA: hypothetical protein NKP23_004452 [Vibrio parahaemolyticus]|uniref:DUF6998 domain-containing protein n=1 Tax=Vibrio parahaemolyticus TaxID=670 RepID=UPI000B786765|nr:hypothetical protein [Vibrio parahaemolyticus]ELA7847804.1 hypothetical protein [Vibrio parahaemolyticus]OXD04581.1 hypothetical protein CA165_23415 [Vibrio parahaemolyticus]HCG8749363.1 hypothetical protein [Vibrio parahaemolyticus]HCH0939414.1 hypothetical protein [Vibrio parahaemolyticus]
MALTQIQVIQSLGESMSWLEREINWGVPITELRHLTGRIGELYAALITNGQMATEVNQSGYDVVSAEGERVSVKTTGRLSNSGHISFNPNTLEYVDRIIVLRINFEEMQIETLFDGSVSEAKVRMCISSKGTKYTLSLSKLAKSKHIEREIPNVKEACWGQYQIVELENGSIEVLKDGKTLSPTKPHLRRIAKELSISTLNSNGNPYNTRQLGSLIIRELLE